MRTVLSSELAERFDELFRVAYRAASRVTRSDQEAEDAAGEAMVRLASHWPSVRSYAPQWVARVAVNAAVDSHRRNRSQSLTADVAAPRVEGSRDTGLDVRASLRALPRRQREVVVLRYIVDLSESDTASALGISTGTVKSHLARALATLRANDQLRAAQ